MNNQIKRIILKALTIDIDIVDINLAEMDMLLHKYNGYVDGDRRQVVIWGRK
jgi:hypothetical protein